MPRGHRTDRGGLTDESSHGQLRLRSGGTGNGRQFVWGAALLSAAAVALTATVVFDQTRSSAAQPPTPADLSTRVERVAAGLKQDPVYADPESSRVLDARQLDRLHERIRDFRRSDGGGPVYVSLVPQTPESESAGDSGLFAAAVHAKVGGDGVYVVADPADGTIDVYNHGLRLDGNRLSFDVPDSVTLGDSRADEADDHLLGERLDALMTFLDDTPRTDRPWSEPAPPAAPSATGETALPALFSTDFWPGLLVGAFAALLLSSLVAGATWVVRGVRRRHSPVSTSVHSSRDVLPVPPALSHTSPGAHHDGEDEENRQEGCVRTLFHIAGRTGNSCRVVSDTQLVARFHRVSAPFTFRKRG